jgi:hypothetical protein
VTSLLDTKFFDTRGRDGGVRQELAGGANLRKGPKSRAATSEPKLADLGISKSPAAT